MIGNAFWDIWTADFTALNALYYVLLPAAFIVGAINWVKDRVKK